MHHDFDLIVARDLPHLLDLLAENPGARIVAGATDFIPFVQVGRWQPRLAVDITCLTELRHCRLHAGWLEVGPLTTHGELAASALVLQHAAVLADAAAQVGDPLIRARATLGGNICTASPAADTIPALLALDAEVVLQNRTGERCLPLAAFLLGPGKTALGTDEVMTMIRFRTPGPATGTAFLKLGRRQAMAISIANAAAVVRVSGPCIEEVRLAMGALAPTVVRCSTAEAFLKGKAAEPQVFEAAARLIDSDIHPIDDVRASAAYRRVVAGELARRALVAALEKA